MSENPKPTACLALADGTVFYGRGFGATGETVAELVFNTAMTGYQEIMTDPSYAGQVVTFTFPHIGNTGTNNEDLESLADAPASGVRGTVVASAVTNPSSWRSSSHLDAFLGKVHEIVVVLEVFFDDSHASPEIHLALGQLLFRAIGLKPFGTCLGPFRAPVE